MRLFLALLAAVATAQPQSESLRVYQDSQNRFQFTYPASFGTPSPGTDSGFRTRIAAIRFSEVSAGVHAGRIILGGEAVLINGPVQLDIQAAGGLYDPITLQVFPFQVAATIQNILPALTLTNVCEAIGREQHLDPSDQRLSALTAQQKAAIGQMDRMGNYVPKVLRCTARGDIVTFDKEVSRGPGAPRVRTYGAIRFLPRLYSSFQLIFGSADPPNATFIQQVTAVLESWKSY